MLVAFEGTDMDDRIRACARVRMKPMRGPGLEEAPGIASVTCE